jgi:hypothetical protein
MTDFKFSHRATGLPGANPETDRDVVCDGVNVGRVYQVDAGQQEGLLHRRRELLDLDVMRVPPN